MTGDSWVMCDGCKHVHQESERVNKPWGRRKGFWISHCPKCDESLMSAQINVPLQRELFRESRA